MHHTRRAEPNPSPSVTCKANAKGKYGEHGSTWSRTGWLILPVVVVVVVVSVVCFGEHRPASAASFLIAQTRAVSVHSYLLTVSSIIVMAPLIDPNTHMSRSTTPSAQSSHLRMPHVFVIPPEEEQQDNPPWCCFDADGQPDNTGDFPSNPDIHFLDVPYLFQPSESNASTPTLHRAPVYPPRPRALMPKKLEKKQRPEAVKIIENKHSLARQKDGREDSDVIEVVKVKRPREALADLEENTKIKRSKTLRARATKALQSIKNVSKRSHRDHVKELWTSSENMPGIFKGIQEQVRSQQGHPPATSPKKGSLSRNSSRSLSQIFRPAGSPRLESTFTVRVETPVTLANAHQAPPTTGPSSPIRLEHNSTNPSLNEVPGVVMSDDALNRPLFSSLSVKKNINTKFSVRELHRLFSFSSSSPDDSSSTPAAATELGSILPTPTSTSSPDYPDVPMEEYEYVDAHLVDLSPDRKPTPRNRRGRRTHREDHPTPRRLSDLSVEMKLDSLHFDALSFDPDDFDVPMEGNVPR